MPVTYGYYLLGLAHAVGRDIAALRSAAEGLRVCPLGAGAVAGTDLPIEPQRTAELLGFSSTTTHALDAVASRDVPLRLLAAAAGLAVTLSRLATDLQWWSTAEFGFVEFPDRLVGGSSAMPQKRNAFLLEHVKAKPGHVIGAYAAAAGMTAAAPFTNSIEVGTEAVAAIWPGLRAAEQAVLLGQVLVIGARPVPGRMAERAATGFTAATSIANRLVHRGVPFRTAHHLVGDAVRRCVEAGSTDLTAFLDLSSTGLTELDLDLSELVDAHRYGGGPGGFDLSHEQAMHSWRDHVDWLAAWRQRRADAADQLAAAVRRTAEVGG
jgi:argininosuccinate lyase